MKTTPIKTEIIRDKDSNGVMKMEASKAPIIKKGVRRWSNNRVGKVNSPNQPYLGLKSTFLL
jgi:hypothetical protein